MSDTLTAMETAALLGVTYETLANYRSAGTGPAYEKLRRRVLYDRVSVHVWLAAATCPCCGQRVPMRDRPSSKEQQP